MLWDVFAESCRLAHLSVMIELGNNLNPDHDHTRPAHILVHNWTQGKPAAFDFSVTSPLNSLNLSEVGESPGAAAEASEIRKYILSETLVRRRLGLKGAGVGLKDP